MFWITSAPFWLLPALILAIGVADARADTMEQFENQTVNEVVASLKSRMTAMDAAKEAYGLSEAQVANYSLCQVTMGGSAQYGNMPYVVVARQCADWAKRQ